MKLVVFIPARNEEQTIGEVIRGIPRKIAGIDTLDIVVSDDVSTDDTVTVAKKAGAIVFRQSAWSHVGAQFQTGLQLALEMGADIMATIDADNQFSPKDIPSLIAPIIAGTADFVASDRFIQPDGNKKRPEYMSPVKFWGNMRVAQLISYLAGAKFNDVACGFRAYSREALLMLNLTGRFTYTQEVFLDLATKNMRIVTMPVKVKYFPGRKSRVTDSPIEYAVRTLKIILRTFRDYKPLTFFGFLSLIPGIPGVMALVFMGVYYWTHGSFTPYKSVGFAGIYLISVVLLLWIVGIFADMFVRLRMNQERILYLQKRQTYNGKK